MSKRSERRMAEAMAEADEFLDGLGQAALKPPESVEEAPAEESTPEPENLRQFEVTIITNAQERDDHAQGFRREATFLFAIKETDIPEMEVYEEVINRAKEIFLDHTDVDLYHRGLNA